MTLYEESLFAARSAGQRRRWDERPDAEMRELVFDLKVYGCTAGRIAQYLWLSKGRVDEIYQAEKRRRLRRKQMSDTEFGPMAMETLYVGEAGQPLPLKFVPVAAEPLAPPDPDHSGNQVARQMQDYVETMLQHSLGKLKYLKDQIADWEGELIARAAHLKAEIGDHFAFGVEAANAAARIEARLDDVRNGKG